MYEYQSNTLFKVGFLRTEMFTAAGLTVGRSSFGSLRRGNSKTIFQRMGSTSARRWKGRGRAKKSAKKRAPPPPPQTEVDTSAKFFTQKPPHFMVYVSASMGLLYTFFGPGINGAEKEGETEEEEAEEADAPASL